MIRPLAIASLALLATHPPAHAGFTYFRTPSGNIHCVYGQAETGIYLDCELREMSNKPLKPRPSDCDLDWGQRFFLGPDGYVEMECYGDTVQSPGSAVLGYGSTITQNGISCVSEKTGLTCRAANGHGFFLSRAKQKLF